MRVRMGIGLCLASLALVVDGAWAADSGQDRRRCAEDNLGDCINGVSSAVTAPDALRTQGPRKTIAGRVKAGGRGGRGGRGGAPGGPSGRPDDASTLTDDGLSAGDFTLAGWGFWTSYARSEFESTNADAPYRADVWAFNLGADRLFGERYLLGVSLGYEASDTATLYNGGGQETDGYGVVPYAAILLSDYVSLDVAGGYYRLSTDQNRIGLGAFNDAIRLRASYDADRYFGSANLNATRDYGTWSYTGRFGYLYTVEEQTAYRETGPDLRQARNIVGRDVSLGQAYAGLELAAQFERLQPYMAAIYRYDVSREDGASAGGLPADQGSTLTEDRDEVEFSFGLRFFGESGVSGGLEWLHTLSRDDFKNQSLQATLRLAL